jgi:EAL domain-containing protein (putative c-di-GMP-specific phosphodiesterase class I)/CheY-like chemotaxis protein
MTSNRLVILDDEKDFCTYIAHVGTECGFDVTATTDRDELIAQVRDDRGCAVILDLHMPAADGVVVLRDLAALGATGSIYIASGADIRISSAALRLGRERGLKMAGVLPKPIRLPDLRNALQKIKPGDDAITPAVLAEAIARDEMVLHYQPRIDLRSGLTTGVEALVRWQHPQRGLLMPGAFIPMAEQSGVIRDLTHWVTKAAVRQCGLWQRQGLPAGMAVNISAADIAGYDLPDRMEELCRCAGVDPTLVTIELTETATMRDPALMMDVATRFRLKDFHLAIDDFGTGYSSLVQLQRLPFSEIKIDRSFVASMTESPDSAIIVATIIGMSRNLGIQCVAEGIETREALDALREGGCAFGQGFYIARPLPADQATELLARGNGVCGPVKPPEQAPAARAQA